MAKVGLVLEGGGLRGIYTAGVLDRLMEEQIWFEYVVGVSAGACNATSYLSRQTGRTGRVLINNFMNPRYLSVRNLLLHGSMFGMDFLFDTIPNHLDPFDYETFAASAVEFEVPVTNLRTGQADYYGKDALEDRRLMLLRATSSIPLISKIAVFRDQPYLDGAVADSIPIQRALVQGCGRCVIVLTQPRGFLKQPMGYARARRLLYRTYPEFLKAMETRHERYNDALRLVEELEREGRALVLAPKKPIPFSSFEKNPDKVSRLYQDGIDDAKEMANQLRAFCGIFPQDHCTSAG